MGPPNAPDPPKERLEHLYWIDWVRFLAAFMVAASHARGGLWVDWGTLDPGSKTIPVALLFGLSRTGAEAVIVFFLLSGMLVGGKMIERIGNGSFDLKSYAIDRVSRIWVPLLPALILTGVVAVVVGRPVLLSELMGAIAGLQGVLTKSFGGNYPLWSLAYEIWFYVLSGACAAWLAASSGARGWLGGGLVVGMAIFTKLLPVFLFVWIMGAIFYSQFGRRPALETVLVGLCLIAAGLATMQLKSESVSIKLTAMHEFLPSAEVGILMFSLGIAISLPLLTVQVPTQRFWVSLNRLGVWFASFSYTLYLTHYPVLYLWEYAMPGKYSAVESASLGWYVARLSSCLLVSWLLYLPFEKQTKRVRVWLGLMFSKR